MSDVEPSADFDVKRTVPSRVPLARRVVSMIIRQSDEPLPFAGDMEIQGEVEFATQPSSALMCTVSEPPSAPMVMVSVSAPNFRFV